MTLAIEVHRQRNRNDYFAQPAHNRHGSNPEVDSRLLKDLVQRDPSAGLAAIKCIAPRGHAPKQEWLAVCTAAGELLAAMTDQAAQKVTLTVLSTVYRYPHLQQSLAAELGRLYALNGDAQLEKLVDAAIEHLPQGQDWSARTTLGNALCKAAQSATDQAAQNRADSKLWLLMKRSAELPGIEVATCMARKRLAASSLLQGCVRRELEGEVQAALGSALIRHLPVIADKEWVRPLLIKLSSAGAAPIREAAKAALKGVEKIWSATRKGG